MGIVLKHKSVISATRFWTRARLTPGSVGWTRFPFGSLQGSGSGVGGEVVLNTERDLLIRLPLRLFGVAGAALGFTQRADGGVAVNLLVTG